jgi:hypothetical protein
MIMPVGDMRSECFRWDETPRCIFRDEPHRLLAARIRKTERELTMFLSEWCGTKETNDNDRN